MYFFFLTGCFTLYISPVFFPQNDSNVVQGVDEFDSLCGETQLADEV